MNTNDQPSDGRNERIGQRIAVNNESPAHDQNQPTMQLPPMTEQTQPIAYVSDSGPIPPSQPPADDQRAPQPEPRHTGAIIAAVIAVIAMLAGMVGFAVYRNRHDAALAECRDAVSSFSNARQDILDVTSQVGTAQKTIRDILGVSDLIDAFADAATSAEQAINDEGCKPTATITQLNIVAKTLNAATDSLRNSKDRIADAARKAAEQQEQQDSQSGTDDGDKDEGNDDQQLQESRQALQNTIDEARRLADNAQRTLGDGTMANALEQALGKAIDSATRLLNDSGIKDSKYYKAAQVTLQEAITAINNWVDGQAAKAQ